MAKRSKKEKEKIAKSSKRLAVGAGAVAGLNMANMYSKIGRKGRAGMALSAGNKAGRYAASALGIGAVVQNVRASEGVGEFIGRDLGNMLRTGGTALAAGGASMLAGAGIRKLRPFAKAVGKSRAARRASKGAAKSAGNPGKTRFIRIKGRIIPIGRKK